MNHHFAEEIARSLVKDNLLHEDAVPLAVDALLLAFEDQIEIVWTVQDVLDTAEDYGYAIDEQEAGEILDDLGRRHDASRYDITWDVIESAIGWFVTDRDNVESEP